MQANPKSDLTFRILFSSIFAGLGGEHLIDDRLIMHLMPPWMPEPRIFSILSGLLLLTGAFLIISGIYLKFAAVLLGSFLIIVTSLVHLPALFSIPSEICSADSWAWIILQRSNFVKNLCLLGVCFSLFHYQPGKYSLRHRFLIKKENAH